MLELADTQNGDRRTVPAHQRIRTCLRHLLLAAPKITLQRGWQRARARVPDTEEVHFHDLRHSAASEMVNAGCDLYTVGQVLGHRDPRSTQRFSHLPRARWPMASARSAEVVRNFRTRRRQRARKKPLESGWFSLAERVSAWKQIQEIPFRPRPSE